MSDEEVDMSVADAISDAIEDAVSDNAGMVTKWVAVVEYLDQDGDRALWILTGDETRPWDSLGLLKYAESEITINSQLGG